MKSFSHLRCTAAGAILALLRLTSLPGAAEETTSPPRQLIPLAQSSWQFLGATKVQGLPAIDSDAFIHAQWQDVQLPHVFQKRGDMTLEQGWYRTRLRVPAAPPGAHFYLIFEGVAIVADVYVNGTHLGQHRGAYTRFIFDATSALHPGADNELAVQVDARKESITDCLPCENGLYTVWGGLYRNAWLMVTGDLSIDPTCYASPGIFITPSQITPTSAHLDIRVLLRNTSSQPASATVNATVLDPAGQVVQTISGQAQVIANAGASVQLSGTINHPQLWEPATPHLYHVRVDVMKNGALADTLTQPLGFRTVDWDFHSGTLKVNGRPFVLYGVDLHQEIEKKASAVLPEDLTANFDGMQDLGVNFVRLSHYPRAALEYDLCDRRGLFCWAENGHTGKKDLPTPTADQITSELVEQNYNHPSILIWSVGNEANPETADREVPIVRALDTTRPVMVANMKSNAADYHAANTYPGWYPGRADLWDLRPKGLITESGAGGVVTCHTDYANASHKFDFYEPEEYQQLSAEALLQQAFHPPGQLGMYTWWVFREFNDFKYKKAEAPFRHGVNSKGLETFAGDKKDVYYLYRSFLRPQEPTLHITSKRYFLRCGAVDNGIKVYGNGHAVTLTLNGATVSTQPNGQFFQTDGKGQKHEVDNVFYWPTPLRPGRNTVAVTDDRQATDSAVIYYFPPGTPGSSPEATAPIRDLASSNPANPAFYMDMPVQPQWPVYDDLDSTADNSLDLLPDQLQGATWVALNRVTKPGLATDLSFTAARALTAYILCTRQDNSPGFIAAQFTPVPVDSLSWRGPDMILTPAQLFQRHLAPGDHVTLSLGDRDALVLFRAD